MKKKSSNPTLSDNQVHSGTQGVSAWVLSQKGVLGGRGHGRVREALQGARQWRLPKE